MSRQALTNAGISPERAVRPTKAFVGSDKHGLQFQLTNDRAHVGKRTHGISVTTVATFRPARAEPKEKRL